MNSVAQLLSWLCFLPPSVSHYLWRGWFHAAYPSYNQTPNYSQGPPCTLLRLFITFIFADRLFITFIFADRLFITFIFADTLFIIFIFADRLSITFIFADRLFITVSSAKSGEDAWSVRKDVAELDEGFLDDGESIEHDHQPPAHVQAEYVSVLTAPRPELDPGVLVQQVEVTQQRQGKAGTRGQSGRSSCGQPPQQGQDQHTAQQQGRGVQDMVLSWKGEKKKKKKVGQKLTVLTLPVTSGPERTKVMHFGFISHYLCWPWRGWSHVCL